MLGEEVGEMNTCRNSGKGGAVCRIASPPGRVFMPNPWDVGTARLLHGLGCEALATTSAGLAYTLGRPDGEGVVTRDEAIAHARALVDATPLPVSADLENCFGERCPALTAS